MTKLTGLISTILCSCLAPLIVHADTFDICPTLSDEYSWFSYVWGIPRSENDPNVRGEGRYLVFVFEALFDDELGQQEDDPYGRILGGTDYTILVHELDGPYFVSGGDDYRGCTDRHWSQNHGGPGTFTVYGRRLEFDKIGRVFDVLTREYIGNLSCVVKQRGLSNGHFQGARGYSSCGDSKPRTYLIDCLSPGDSAIFNCAEVPPDD